MAAEAYEKALALEPTDDATLEGLAHCYTAVGDIEKASLAWRNLLRNAPEREDAWFRLGLLNYDAKQPQEAVKDFDPGSS